MTPDHIRKAQEDFEWSLEWVDKDTGRVCVRNLEGATVEIIKKALKLYGVMMARPQEKIDG